MKFCSKCGTQLEEGISLCPKCGNNAAANMAGTEPNSKTKQKSLMAFVITVISDVYLLICCLALLFGGGGLILELFRIKVTGISDDVFREAMKQGFSNPYVIGSVIIIMAIIILTNIIPIIVHKNNIWSYLSYSSRTSKYADVFDVTLWTVLYFIGPSIVYTIVMNLDDGSILSGFAVTDVTVTSLFFVFTIVGFVLASLKLIFNKSVKE